VTAVSLITAVTVGALLGLAGRLATSARRRTPLWLPVAVGVGAALLGTIIARLADSEAAGLTRTEVVLQVVLGVLGVALVVATGDRRPVEGEQLR
jgi:hypothetical protein